MRGWSINLFRIRGILISLHYSFLLLLAYAAYEGWAQGGVTEMWWSAGIVVAFFVCISLHELGHSLTAMRFGVRVLRIQLRFIGGVAEFNRIPRNPSEELLITIAGPSVNFVIAGLLWFVVRANGGFDAFDAVPWGDFIVTLLTWNVWVGLFNLIPAFPMDGGRILRALLAMRLPYLRATWWAVSIAKVVTVVGAGIAFYEQRYLMMCVFLYIFPAGELEYRSVKRYEEAESQWRESLIRNVTPPPQPDPPVLGP
jgi:Zn-dependent protease